MTKWSFKGTLAYLLQDFRAQVVEIVVDILRVVVQLFHQRVLFDERDGELETAQTDLTTLRNVNIVRTNASMNDVLAVQIVHGIQQRLGDMFERLLVENEIDLLVGSIVVDIGACLKVQSISSLPTCGRHLVVLHTVYTVENVATRTVEHERIRGPYLRFVDKTGQQVQYVLVPQMACASDFVLKKQKRKAN